MVRPTVKDACGVRIQLSPPPSPPPFRPPGAVAAANTMLSRHSTRDRRTDSVVRHGLRAANKVDHSKATKAGDGRSTSSKQATVTTVYKPKACRSLSRFLSVQSVPKFCMDRAKGDSLDGSQVNMTMTLSEPRSTSSRIEPQAEPTPGSSPYMGPVRSNGSHDLSVSNASSGGGSVRRAGSIRVEDMMGRHVSSRSMSPSRPHSPREAIRLGDSVSDISGPGAIEELPSFSIKVLGGANGQPSQKAIRGGGGAARSRTDSGLGPSRSGVALSAGCIDHDLPPPRVQTLDESASDMKQWPGVPPPPTGASLTAVVGNARQQVAAGQGLAAWDVNGKSKQAKQSSPRCGTVDALDLTDSNVDEAAIACWATRRFGAKQATSVRAALRGERGRTPLSDRLSGSTGLRSPSVDALVDYHSMTGPIVGLPDRAVAHRVSGATGIADSDCQGREERGVDEGESYPSAGADVTDGRVGDGGSCPGIRRHESGFAFPAGGHAACGGGGGGKRLANTCGVAWGGKSGTCASGCTCVVCSPKQMRPAGLDAEIDNNIKNTAAIRIYRALPESHNTDGVSPSRTRMEEPPWVEDATGDEVSNRLGKEMGRKHRVGRALSMDDIPTSPAGQYDFHPKQSLRVRGLGPSKSREADLCLGRKIRSQYSDHFSEGTERLCTQRHKDLRMELPHARSPPGSPHSPSVTFPVSPGTTTTAATEACSGVGSPAGCPMDEVNARIVRSKFAVAEDLPERTQRTLSPSRCSFAMREMLSDGGGETERSKRLATEPAFADLCGAAEAKKQFLDQAAAAAKSKRSGANVRNSLTWN
eukprot:TRINITY_DN40711_c0_g1_i1.p1 TRINITY_DN40711_c0_g1~~TRINITY_DN40711_c0_g1_i1.p1  ORF type:complete len:814 (+),score=127.73 TRINITY_DN40711_c0_g1_i1:159-2600(+)